MKKIIFVCTLLVSVLMCITRVVAQDEIIDRVTVKLTDPEKPCFLELNLINGGIKVTGYDGKEVLVESKSRLKKISQKKRNKTPDGMIRIPVNSSSMSVEEYNNRVKIETVSWKTTIDVNLKVPRKTSLELRCVNHGDIVVENVTGDLEIDNINGAVTLQGITGSVVAHSLNKKLKVVLNKVFPDKVMSFSTLNGDIDITFPSDIKASVKIKNEQGDVYSDFQIQKVDKPRDIIEENNRDKDGKYRVRIGTAFYGTINGGGPEFQFTSFNGDIFIRKAK